MAQRDEVPRGQHARLLRFAEDALRDAGRNDDEDLAANAVYAIHGDGTGEGEMTDLERIKVALALAVDYGGIDGAHHKAWVIDQMVRVLAGDRYSEIVAKAQDGEHGPETYEWDTGVAP